MSQFRTAVDPSISALTQLRRSLDTWLNECGMDEPERSAIVLATHEAVANAIEHAGVVGSIGVSADERLGTFAVDVSDDGHWKSPIASPERGRGLTLIRGLVSDARIVTGASGTTVHLRQRLPERSLWGVRRSGAPPAAA